MPRARSCVSSNRRASSPGASRRLVERQAPLGEIPHTLLPGATRDHHLALGPQHLEHHRRVPPVVVPPAGPPADGGAILERSGLKRSLGAQPGQDVPAERLVLSEVAPHVLAPAAGPARVPPHRLPVHRILRRRQDERPVLEQRAVLPQESLQLGDAEPPPEPGPEDEVLRPRDPSGWDPSARCPRPSTTSRIERGSRRGEQLCCDRDLPRPFGARSNEVRAEVTRRARPPRRPLSCDGRCRRGAPAERRASRA